MRRIIAARVIARQAIRDLNADLEQVIAEGWQPLGPHIETVRNESYFSMTIVKYDETTEPPPIRP